MRRSTILSALVVWPLVAALLTLLLRLSLFPSIILFHLVPAVFISFWVRPDWRRKAAVFAAVAGVIPALLVDHVGHIAAAWNVQTMFPRIGMATVETTVWGGVMTYFIVVLYEQFFQYGSATLHHRVWYLAAGIAGTAAAVLGLMVGAPTLLEIPYFYAVFGVAVLLPPVLLQLYRFPGTRIPMLHAWTFFAYLQLVQLLTGVVRGHWTYPGTEFLAWISLPGLRFPVEELLFYVAIFPATILAVYQYFGDGE